MFDEEGGGGALSYPNPAVCPTLCTFGNPRLSAVLLGEGGARALLPDGKWVIAVTQGSPRQLKLLTTGAGEPKDLTNDNINHAFAHWFPDGKRILFSGNEPGKGVRLYVYEIASGKSQAITPEGVNGTRFVISPDAQWVAGIGPDQKGYLYPVGGGEPRMINGLNPGEQPITFSSEGRSLYLYQPGELPARVDRLDLQTGKRTPWKQLMPSDPAGFEISAPFVDPRREELCLWIPPHAGRPLPS